MKFISFRDMWHTVGDAYYRYDKLVVVAGFDGLPILWLPAIFIALISGVITGGLAGVAIAIPFIPKIGIGLYYWTKFLAMNIIAIPAVNALSFVFSKLAGPKSAQQIQCDKALHNIQAKYDDINTEITQIMRYARAQVQNADSFSQQQRLIAILRYNKIPDILTSLKTSSRKLMTMQELSEKLSVSEKPTLNFRNHFLTPQLISKIRETLIPLLFQYYELLYYNDANKTAASDFLSTNHTEVMLQIEKLRNSKRYTGEMQFIITLDNNGKIKVLTETDPIAKNIIKILPISVTGETVKFHTISLDENKNIVQTHNDFTLSSVPTSKESSKEPSKESSKEPSKESSNESIPATKQNPLNIFKYCFGPMLQRSRRSNPKVPTTGPERPERPKRPERPEQKPSKK